MKTQILGPRLRHRANIQSLEIIQDSETGAISEGWADYLVNEPMEIVPLSGREFISADAKQAGVTTRVTMRFNSGVIPSMRIVHGALFYQIKAVLPDSSLRRHITLMCEVGVNDGS